MMNDVFRTGDVSPIRYFGLLAIMLGVLFALLNPEGTTDRGFFFALMQWMVQTVAPMGLGIVSHRLLHQSRRMDRLHPWLKLTFSGALAALLFSPLAYGIDAVMEVDKDPLSWTGWADEVGGVFFPVTFAWVAINAPFVLGYQWQRAMPEPAPAVSVAVPPGVPETSTATALVPPAPFFLSLIPAERRGEVISLKAELHYLTVTTTKGRSMILYALGDAIEELPVHAGIQTHRSYWASLPHSVRLERTGRNAQLTLSDGSVVPVSRNRMADVKRAMGID
jgi:hypothetical protein